MNHIFPLENYHFDLSKRRKTCKAEGGALNAKELNTSVNDDQGNIDY